MRLHLLDQAFTVLTAQIYKVMGNSMLPNFKPGDRVIVNCRAYLHDVPDRGDVVIIRDPRDHSQFYLKRIVGLPGEEVRITEGILFIDGNSLIEPHLNGLPSSSMMTIGQWNLGKHDYFLMGDRRTHSTDSRVFGPVDHDLILGKTLYRCWPPSRLGSTSSG